MALCRNQIHTSEFWKDQPLSPDALMVRLEQEIAGAKWASCSPTGYRDLKVYFKLPFATVPIKSPLYWHQQHSASAQRTCWISGPELDPFLSPPCSGQPSHTNIFYLFPSCIPPWQPADERTQLIPLICSFRWPPILYFVARGQVNQSDLCRATKSSTSVN